MVLPILFDLQDTDRATLNDDTWIRRHIPEHHRIERIAVGSSG